MPELPEVEHVRRLLERSLVGRTPTAVTIRRRDVVATPDDPPGGFSRNTHRLADHPRPRRVPKAQLLAGDRIAHIRRRGKQLALVGASGRALLVHLGMTGQLLVAPRGRRLRQPDHLHVLWRLDDGARLAFRDPRRFGGLWTLPDPADLERRWAGLGPDALDIDGERLAPPLARTARPVKAALLDQALLAGVGNIYADEALHDARIHPLARADRLAAPDVGRLARAVRRILADAVNAGGSTLRDYLDPDQHRGSYQHRHAVYGRAGEPCRSCGAELAAGVVAQRTTVWCPACQPDPAGDPPDRPGPERPAPSGRSRGSARPTAERGTAIHTEPPRPGGRLPGR